MIFKFILTGNFQPSYLTLYTGICDPKMKNVFKTFFFSENVIYKNSMTARGMLFVFSVYHTLQNKLEKVQNGAARSVTGNYNFETGSMTKILEQLKWESLQERWKVVDSYCFTKV